MVSQSNVGATIQASCDRVLGNGYRGDTGAHLHAFRNDSVEAHPGRFCGCVDLRVIGFRNSSRLAGVTVTTRCLCSRSRHAALPSIA